MEIAKILTSTLDFDEVLRAAVAEIVGMCKLADAGVICLYHEDADSLVVSAHFGYPEVVNKIVLHPGQGAPGRVFLSRQPALFRGEERVAECYASAGSENQPYLNEILLARSSPTTSLLCAPFLVRGQAIGSIQLEHWTDRRTFTDDDVGLLSELADLIAIAVDNGRLWRELKQKEEISHQMVVKLITAQEEERERVARELHDEIGQALTAVLVGLSSLVQILPSAPAELHAKVASLQNTVKEIMVRVRHLMLAVRPTMLDDLGLVAAIKWYIFDFLGSSGLAIDLEVEDAGDLTQKLDPLVEVVIFRVAQEALNNAVRYSQASEIRVKLTASPRAIYLAIQDNGVGFDVDAVMQDIKRSLGLHGMVERVSFLQGTLHITSAPGQGTSLNMVIPLRQSGPMSEEVQVAWEKLG